MATVAITAANLKTVPTLAAGADTTQAIVLDATAPVSAALATPVATINQAFASFAAANTAGNTALPTTNVHFFDATVSVSGDVTGDAFKGTTPNIVGQFFDLTPDNMLIKAKPNFLIASATGNDTLVATGGRNILFGDSGTDTYIGGTAASTNAAGAAVPSQDTFIGSVPDGKTDMTIFNFHTADDAVLKGVDATNFALSFADSALGLVLTASPTTAGHNGATLTLAGFSTADIGGALSFGVNTSAAGSFLFVHGN
jgi:hypothetical protein